MRNPPVAFDVYCEVHGSQMAPRIAPVGPTLTRPKLVTIDRIEYQADRLYQADPDCQHYVTYGPGGGVRCVRCPGWYCA